jgi:glycosyltransferase involved in cell wall biosynthesis
MIRLSCAIITYNEERNIARCLDSLAGIADEIVVVDSGSTDKTEDICKKYGVKFVYHPFEGHIEQKNFAITQCTSDFILSLDADEALSEELKKSIIAVKNNWEKDGYTFNRLTNYCGKWVHHCGWYPDTKLRLFKKGKGKWGGSNPHDRYELNDKGKTEKIKGDLLHYSYYTIKDHLTQINKFSGIAAKVAFEEGKRSSIILMLVKPGFKFFRDYILKLGILDGSTGFIICRMSMFASFSKYAKLYELQRNNSNH